MTYTCENAEQKIIDYLDGQLDEKQRQLMEDHLKACTTCANDLAMQKAWLEEKVPLVKKDPERLASDHFHLKVMAAVRHAADLAEDTPADETNEEEQNVVLLPWYRRFTTRNILTTAAALVVLVVSIQVFAGLYQSTLRTGDPEQDTLIGDLSVNAGETSLEFAEEIPFDADRDDLIDEDIGIMGEDDALINDTEGGIEASEPAVIDDGGQDYLPEIDLFALDWQVYTGFLADLPVGGSLFVRQDPEETEPAARTTETDEPDLIAPDDPDADSTDPSAGLIDGDGDTTQEALKPQQIMEKAQAIRVLTREGPPAETLLLTFWNNNSAAKAWQDFYMMSQTWTYRSAVYQMSAANAQAQLREELGSALTEEIFTDININRWEIVLIRIGE